MGKIDYESIYNRNKHGWYDMTEDPQKYEALLAGHYSDSNHFVYELLQNAEDERANKVVIQYYEDKLVFYHNGDPFDEDDVRGVSSMLMGTKDSDDAQTIGRFGMGFKSVFKYTYQPEIYSDDESFCITNYLLPVEIKNEWDYKKVKEEIKCPVSGGSYFFPFKTCDHLTKIVIPFTKKDKNGNIISIPGKDVLDKLNELNGEILLFLTYIKELYWCDMRNGIYTKISLNHSDSDANIVTCEIVGKENEFGVKKDSNISVTRYLQFRYRFDHPEMKGAEVSIAYKLNSRGDNINELKGSNIWVYFPTREHTNLPFLVHGSFETAVSREKLMFPSSFNDDLFNELAKLIAQSLSELKKRNLITQHFLRYILMESFKDESVNSTIPGLREVVTAYVKDNNILPNSQGECSSVKDLMIAVPHQISEFYGRRLFEETFPKKKAFVAFNNEKESNFTEYFEWLTIDVGIQIYSFKDWAEVLSKQKRRNLDISSTQIGKENLGTLELLYDFLTRNMESVYDNNLSYTRSGPYEKMIRDFISDAWKFLRKSTIILSADGRLVSAYWKNKPCVYTGFTSQYKRVNKSALVHKKITEKYNKLLDEGFQIKEFNNFQYVKEKVIAKYIDIDDGIEFDNPEDFTKEYIEDIGQILDLMDSIQDNNLIKEMLANAYIVKVVDENGEDSFEVPGRVYVSTSQEGIDLRTYFAPVLDVAPEEYGEDKEYNEDAYIYSGYSMLDEDFFIQYQIDIEKFSKIGLITTPICEGIRKETGVGDNHWTALGEFCPNIEIKFLDENLEFIFCFEQLELAKKKSSEILRLLLLNVNKLLGKVRYRKNNPYEIEQESSLLKYTIKTREWLYGVEENLSRLTNMSRYDLDKNVYGQIRVDKSVFLKLGFIEKEEDGKADAFEMVDNLKKKDKMILLKQLANQLGKEISDKDEWNEDFDENLESNIINEDEFPEHRVKNYDNLLRHVREGFFCADPVLYQKVWRQIRVSKSNKFARAYVTSMYMNENRKYTCQLCKKSFAVNYIEAIELANFGIELPQLNLCLCKNCATDYKNVRDREKDTFKIWLEQVILGCDVLSDSNECELKLNNLISIKFTQTHLAEIQEIFRLLKIYGIPSEEEKTSTEWMKIGKEEGRDGNHPVNKIKSQLGVNILKVGTDMSDIDDSRADNLFRNGDAVLHSRFGKGIVTTIDEKHIYVKFGLETKTFGNPCSFLKRV